MVTVLAVELDPADPPQRLTEWLEAAGAQVDVIRPHASDRLPDELPDAVICLGGRYGVYDHDNAPHLAEVRVFLDKAVTASTPLLAIGLGARLLAVATGGRVEPRQAGYRLGAALAAKRDDTEHDLLLGMVPITPDVMEFHRESITMLPGGSALLLSSPGEAVEAFRVGSAAWGLTFHIETTAEQMRSWRDDPGWGVHPDDRLRSERAFGSMLDEAETLIGEVWPAIVARFVHLIRDGIPQTPTGHAAPRLPIVGHEIVGH